MHLSCSSFEDLSHPPILELHLIYSSTLLFRLGSRDFFRPYVAVSASVSRCVSTVPKDMHMWAGFLNVLVLRLLSGSLDIEECLPSLLSLLKGKIIFQFGEFSELLPSLNLVVGSDQRFEVPSTI
jgi:hypothetical protein